MLHIRVDEAVLHVIGKLEEIILRKIQGRKKLLEHHFVDEAADELILTAFLDGVEAAEVSDRREDGMRSVQERDLSLMIRSLRRDKEDMEAGLVCRELRSHFLRRLDYPEMENLGLVKQIVLVADPLADTGRIVARIARHDTIHKGRIHTTGRVKPLREFRSELPEIDILPDALLQMLSVFENQFARENDKALRLVTGKMPESVIKELRELAGIREGGRIIQLAVRIEFYSGLCRIRYDETYLRLLRQLEIILEIDIGIDSPAYDINHFDAVHSFPFINALKIEMVESILLVEHIHPSLVDGLDHNYRCIEIRLLVCFPDDPIDKGPEEITLSELNDFFGVGFGLCCSPV